VGEADLALCTFFRNLPCMDSNHDEAIHCFLALKDSLEVTDAELHIEPIRFWLATFKRAGTDEAFYAVVLQDGTIVEAQDRRESLKL